VVDRVNNSSIQIIQFDHGVELNQLDLKEKKVGVFGRMLPELYASFYNLNAKRRRLDGRVICLESKIYTATSDVYNQVVNAKKTSKTIVRFAKWKIFKKELKSQGEAKFLANKKVKDAFTSIIKTDPDNRSDEAKITLKHIVTTIQEYSLNSFSKTHRLGNLVTEYLKLENDTLCFGPDNDTKSNLLSEYFFLRDLRSIQKRFLKVAEETIDSNQSGGDSLTLLRDQLNKFYDGKGTVQEALEGGVYKSLNNAFEKDNKIYMSEFHLLAAWLNEFKDANL
jgi:hypothetical protein